MVRRCFQKIAEKVTWLRRVEFSPDSLVKTQGINAQNFMSYDKISLKFTKRCVILCGEETGCGKSAIINAIKFITDSVYVQSKTAQPLKKDNLFTGGSESSSVKITFEFTDTDEICKKLEAFRNFFAIDTILYKIQDFEDNILENGHLPIVDFQKRFETDSKVFYPFIDYDVNNSFEENNLLSFWQLKLYTMESIETNSSRIGAYFKHTDDSDENRHLLLLALEHQLRLLEYEKLEVFKMYFNAMNTINMVFKQLTSEDYSVVFYIEDNGELKNFTKPDNFSSDMFYRIVTMVEHKESKILWKGLGSQLKYILKIATKIALAKNHNHKFIFIENMDKLKDQDAELAKSLIVLKHCPELAQNLMQNKFKPFLKKIIEICDSYEITAIMEYRGTLNGAEDANIVQCENRRTTTICYIEDSMSIDDYLYAFEHYFV